MDLEFERVSSEQDEILSIKRTRVYSMRDRELIEALRLYFYSPQALVDALCLRSRRTAQLAIPSP